MRFQSVLGEVNTVEVVISIRVDFANEKIHTDLDTIHLSHQ